MNVLRKKFRKGAQDLAKREDYERKTEELLTPILEANGFELVGC